jgi:hypothetical protein
MTSYTWNRAAASDLDTGQAGERGRVTLDEFFAGYEESRPVFDALYTAIEALGPVEIQVSKSQVAFRRRKPFALAWVPARYLRGLCPPVVLTLLLACRHRSPRWKQIVEPVPGRFTHHLELLSAA